MALPTFGLTPAAATPAKTGNVAISAPVNGIPAISTNNVNAVATTSQKNSSSTYFSNYAGVFSGVFGLSYLTDMINQVNKKSTPPPAIGISRPPPAVRPAPMVPIVPPPSPPMLRGQRTGVNDYRNVDNTKIRFNDADPYQSLTGISQQRPELISLTTFKPIYVDSYHHAKQQFKYVDGETQWLTAAGKFFDTATQAKSLKQHNVITLLTTTLDDHLEAYDASRTINDTINQSIADVQEISSYVNSALIVVKNLKDGLDPRQLLSLVKDEQIDKIRKYYVPSTALADNTKQGFQSSETTNSQSLLSLMRDLGYTDSSLKSYCATKIWFQMLVELRQSLKYQTRTMLDIEPIFQMQDNDPSVILRSREQQFDLAPMILPASSDMINLSPGQEESLSALIETAYYNFSLSTNAGRVFRNNAVKCATLLDFLAKDYRYSVALGSRDFLDMMQTSYGFTPNSDPTVGNESMIDYVIGALPITAFDVPIKNENNSLSSLAQTSAENLAIKTFESTYVQARAGTLTPGTAYYGDSIFSLTSNKTFDTANVRSLSLTVSKLYDSFGKFVKMTNSSPWSAGLSELETSRFESLTLSDKMTNGSAIVRELASQLLMGTDNPNVVAPIWEPAASLFSHVYESNDQGLKSDLFLFVFYLMLEKQQTITTPKTAAVPIPQPVQRSVPNGVTPSEAPAIKALLDVVLNRNTPASPAAPSRPSPAVKAQQPKFSDYFLNRIDKKLQQLPDLTNNLAYPSPRGSMKEVNDAVMTSNLRDVLFKSQPMSLKPFLDVIVDFCRNVFNRYKTDALVNGLSRYNVISDIEFLLVLFESILAIVAGSCGRKFVGKKLENSSWQYVVMTAKFSREGQSPWQFVNNVIRRFDSKQDSLIWFVLLELEQLKSRTDETINAMKSYDKILSKIEKYVSLQDPAQQLMFKEHQFSMLISNSIDYVDEFKNLTSNERVRLLDNASATDPVVKMIKALVGQEDFLQGKGFNKKIASVGIPVGFYELLKFNRSTYRQNVGYDAKQQDIISINVYATNMLKPDVVFKPIKYYFEISRFPARSASKFLSIPVNPSLLDIVRAVPTRDISQNSSAIPQYYDPIQPGLMTAFDDESYSFVSAEMKWQLAKNHVLSYLFEAYIRNMTGVDVSERAFPFIDSTYKVDPRFVELLFQCRANDYAYTISKSRSPQRSNILWGNNLGVFDYTSRDAYGNKKNPLSLNPTSVALEAIPAAFTDQLLHELNVLFDFSTTWTSLSDGPTFVRSLLSTKKFDRVLHVPIDPDDFKIDVEKTTTTLSGRSILNSLLLSNEVETNSDGSLSFVEATSDDASMYNYFVTIESYDPSEGVT